MLELDYDKIVDNCLALHFTVSVVHRSLGEYQLRHRVAQKPMNNPRSLRDFLNTCKIISDHNCHVGLDLQPAAKQQHSQDGGVQD
jgi:hypothetical protein